MKKNNADNFPMGGKVAWNTGASAGIGEELCYQFARQGVSLILSARRREKLEAVKSRLASFPVKVKILPLDLEQLASLPAKAEEALNYFGKIDFLVHNARIGLRDFALDTSLSIDQKIININYFGPLAITKVVVPQMIKRGSGHLVVISNK